MYKEQFNPSQIMTERYYEFHHSYNEVPPVVEFHQHPFYEIFFFLSGNVTYIIEGRSYKLRPGDILLTSSSDIHRPDIRPGRPYERIVIWLADDFFERLQDFFDEDFTACFTDAALKDYRLIRPDSQNIAHLKQLCDEMSKARHSREMGSQALTSAYLTEFLVYVSRAYYDAPDSAHPNQHWVRALPTTSQDILPHDHAFWRNIRINVSLSCNKPLFIFIQKIQSK